MLINSKETTEKSDRGDVYYLLRGATSSGWLASNPFGPAECSAINSNQAQLPMGGVVGVPKAVRLYTCHN